MLVAAAEDIAISAGHLVALARRVVEDRLASAVAAVVVVAVLIRVHF